MTQMSDHIRTSWHLVALSSDLSLNQTISRAVAGTSVAIFRGASGVAGLLDRCPHRNYPLSRGRVVNDSLQCEYHGWRFAPDGACLEVPGCMLDLQNKDKLSARAVRVTERHGGIFVNLSYEGNDELVLPPLMGAPDHDHFWWAQGVWNGRAFDAVENVLDPFHTNFIHHGFIRRKDHRLNVQLDVNTFERGIEMVIEQTQPDLGIMSRFLEGDRIRSRTRYYPPTIVQAQWQGKKKLTLCVTAFFTPESDDTLRPFACFTTPKGFAPGWLKEAAIRLFLTPVVAQDRRALERQNKVVRRFGVTRYAQGPGDLLGARVQRLYSGESLIPGSDESKNFEL